MFTYHFLSNNYTNGSTLLSWRTHRIVTSNHFISYDDINIFCNMVREVLHFLSCTWFNVMLLGKCTGSMRCCWEDELWKVFFNHISSLLNGFTLLVLVSFFCSLKLFVRHWIKLIAQAFEAFPIKSWNIITQLLWLLYYYAIVDYRYTQNLKSYIKWCMSQKKSF